MGFMLWSGLGALGGAWLGLIVLISFWELIWKGIALWKCGRNNQLVWFVFILIFNTATGILSPWFQPSE